MLRISTELQGRPYIEAIYRAALRIAFHEMCSREPIPRLYMIQANVPNAGVGGVHKASMRYSSGLKWT